jgi:hypothetical protein
MLSRHLAKARSEGELLLCPVAWAESFAHPKANESFIRDFLIKTGIRVDYELVEGVWAESGRRFAQYAARRRRSGGDEPGGFWRILLLALMPCSEPTG